MPNAALALVQYAVLSAVAVVPTQPKYADHPACPPACSWLLILAHCVVKNQAADAQAYSSGVTKAKMAFSCASLKPVVVPAGAIAVAAALRAGMDSAYSRLKLAICIFLVPCPGLPGKWLMAYLKSAVSKAIKERSADISGGE